MTPSSTRSDDDVHYEAAMEANRSASWGLVICGALVIVVLAATVALLIWLGSTETGSGPEAALSLVFVAAAVVLILVVGGLAVVLMRLKLTNRDEAMGLP